MLSKKHGECAGFIQFETQHGSEAASDVLDRICEELWSRGSQFGIVFHDIEYHDPCNCTASGRVEHRGAWYDFTLRNGNFDGMVVEAFDLAVDVEDATAGGGLMQDPALVLQAALEGYLKDAEHVHVAGRMAMRDLKERFKPGRVSAATRQVHMTLRAILGDLAVQAEEYTSEAMQLADCVLTRPAQVHALFKLLSPELQHSLQQASQKCPEYGDTVEFLAAGLAPAYDNKFF